MSRSLCGGRDRQVILVIVMQKGSSLTLAKVAFECDTPFIIEHPENLGATPRGIPASIWDLETMRELARITGA